MKFFEDFKVSKPEFNLLPVGEHVVRIVRMEETSSFQQFNGTQKDELPPWKDAEPQLAITFVSAEEGKTGGITHRFNGLGYTKFDELSAEDKKSGDYEDHKGYACTLNEDGLLVRVRNEKRTKACENILNQLAGSLGIKEGTSLGTGLQTAIADQTKLVITVTNDPFEGRDQMRATRFRSITAKTVDADWVK